MHKSAGIPCFVWPSLWVAFLAYSTRRIQRPDDSLAIDAASGPMMAGLACLSEKYMRRGLEVITTFRGAL